MKNQSVLISGVGIAGATLAYWLIARGFQVTLVEQAAAPREGGYIIDFWGLGYDIAERMGILPALKEKGYDIQELRFVDDRGRRTGGFDVDVFRSLTKGRYVSLPRGDLAKLIYDRIDGHCEMIFGDSIAKVTQSDHGVEITFERAPPRQFDIVVGADGLHSAVRRLAFGREDRFEGYLGYLVAAFEIKGYRPRDEGVYIAYAAPGRQVGRFAMRGDRTVFLFAFAADQLGPIDPQNKGPQKALLHAMFDGAGWECADILASLDSLTEVYFDRVSQIRMQSWSHGRAALVGDAAFAPSFLAGQGSALAMIGAYVLAGELARSDGRHEIAFQRYELLLHGFMLDKQRAAERFARSIVPRTRFGVFFRNQMTKVMAIPGLAKLTMGSSLLDRVDLPEYRE